MSLWSCLTLREPMTVACQAPLSFGFSRQEYWSELLFSSLGIFPTQGLNLCRLLWQVDSLPLSHLGRPVEKVMQQIKQGADRKDCCVQDAQRLQCKGKHLV